MILSIYIFYLYHNINIISLSLYYKFKNKRFYTIIKNNFYNYFIIIIILYTTFKISSDNALYLYFNGVYYSFMVFISNV